MIKAPGGLGARFKTGHRNTSTSGGYDCAVQFDGPFYLLYEYQHVKELKMVCNSYRGPCFYGKEEVNAYLYHLVAYNSVHYKS